MADNYTEGGSSGERSDHSSSDHEDLSGIFPAYALYRYQPNRPKDACPSRESDMLESSVHDFLQKEATADGNFSLSVVATSLNAEHETDLRELIASKLIKGTVYSGRGNITSLKLQLAGSEKKTAASLCYFCLLRDEQTFQNQSGDGLTKSYCSNEFVVCFLTDVEVTLDLFKPELDKYSMELMEVLDSDLLDLESVVKPILQRWPDDVLHYVERCVARLKEDLQYLIYAALLDIKVNIVTEDKQLKKDLTRFVECCGLSELLHQLKTDVRTPAATPSDGSLASLLMLEMQDNVGDTANLPSPQATLNLTLLKDTHSFDSTECTFFCETWAQSLASGDPAKTVFLKQIIDNFKLKAIQDMNTLKRLIRQAETDYYALYRAFVFLQKSGNAEILLQHARTEHCSLTSADAQKVVRVLEDFMLQDKNEASRCVKSVAVLKSAMSSLFTSAKSAK